MSFDTQAAISYGYFGRIDAEVKFRHLLKKMESRMTVMNALLSMIEEERCSAERVIRLAGQMDGALDELHDHIVALREHCAHQVEKAGQR